MTPTFVTLAVAAALSMQATAPPQAGAAVSVEQRAVPKGPALTEAIGARSKEYFALFFEGCDPEKLRSMLTEDYEFYHDRNGITHSAERFVMNYANRCRERATPTARRLRRELVQGTQRIFPVPGFGAIEEGHHRFYPRQGDGPESNPSFGRYLHYWALEADGWRLSRVFSYDHQRAQ